MKLVAIVRTNLVRTLRDRTALFFSVLLPLILILVLGLTFSGRQAPRVGLVDEDGTGLAAELVATLAAGDGDLALDLRQYATLADLREATARGYVELGIGIPAGYDAALRSGQTASLEILAAPTEVASATRSMVEDAITRQQAIVRAARFAEARLGIGFEAAFELARRQAANEPPVGVRVEAVGEAPEGGLGFSMGAQSQLILFIFLTSLTGAVELVVTRQLGVSRRMFATPTGIWTIIAGEGLGRIVVALAQGLLIVFASALLFGVEWGDPVAIAAIVIAFSLVGGAAAMLVGAVATSPSQAGALGPALGMLLGLLGGTMVTAEVFPDAVRTLSHLTPHAWAMDAFSELNAGGGTIAILPQLGVLLGFAAALGGAAVLRFRRVLAG